MSVHFVLRSALLAVVVLLVGVASVVERPPMRRPNVLLISIDSLRADHLSAYGYGRPTSPLIDSLASEGVRFETAISTSSWTLPAHVTMLTALPPTRHGVVASNRRLQARALTLAEVLGTSGYETVAFVAGPYLKSMYGFDQGFERYDESSVREGSLSHAGITSPGQVELTIEFLERWEAEERQRPFFIFLHLWDVHYDYDPPPPYDTMFGEQYSGEITGSIFQTGVERDMAPEDLAHVVALYDGEIRFTDETLSELFRWMRDHQVLDGTVVVLTSDHGEEFFEHGRIGHGHTLYDETLRVPLILRYPRRVPAGLVVANQVRMVDVAPTILGLVGVTPPPGFGTAFDTPSREMDLTPWITGRRGADSFPELLAHSRTSLGARHWQSVRSRGAKYAYSPGRKPVERYFDLVRDPGERFDVSRVDPPPPEAERLATALQRRRERWTDDDLAEPMEIDPGFVESLRALGYVE